MRSSIRSQLIKHPVINPYKVFRAGFFRTITNPIRTLPDFLIIGAPKCGTTSVYDYLIRHPNIFPAKEKEVQFFNSDSNVGYRSYFPTVFTKYYKKSIQKQSFITGESTPHYLYSDKAPERVKRLIPHAKLIIILRNPIDRSYSHYNFHVKNRNLKVSFEKCIQREMDQKRNPDNDSTKFETVNEIIKSGSYPYLEDGIYVDKMEKWMEIFPQNQFLILEINELKNPQKFFTKIFEFLQVLNHEIKNIDKKNVGKYEKMDNKTRDMLIEYFKPHNDRLCKFLGQKFDWDK